MIDFDPDEFIDLHISAIGEDVDFGNSWPIVDPLTLIIIGFVDGNYPEEFNDGCWTTGALVDGEIKLGEHYCDFAVATDDNEKAQNGKQQ